MSSTCTQLQLPNTSGKLAAVLLAKEWKMSTEVACKVQEKTVYNNQVMGSVLTVAMLGTKAVQFQKMY